MSTQELVEEKIKAEYAGSGLTVREKYELLKQSIFNDKQMIDLLSQIIEETLDDTKYTDIEIVIENIYREEF